VTQHPIDALEALIEQGRALEWEVERKTGRVWVTVSYLEYDADSPKGVCCVAHGYGFTLGDAVKDVVGKLPAVKV
jgi:hypothetical protein